MNKKCNFCGGVDYDERRTDYLYSYKGDYLLVPNTPVEVCQTCGMVYYPAKVLKEIEDHFFDIQDKKIKPDNYLEIPRWAMRGECDLARRFGSPREFLKCGNAKMRKC